ncbi:acyl carrier protein [Spirochaetia bacterium]|nr:acyl carrier protein [Spirochaetia bacterium]
MTKQEVFTKMKEILSAEFELSLDQITPDALLYQDLGLDSIDAVDLIVKMKPYLPGKLDAELFKKAKTVQDVVEILQPLTEG